MRRDEIRITEPILEELVREGRIKLTLGNDGDMVPNKPIARKSFSSVM